MAHAGHELGAHQDGAHQFLDGAFRIGSDVSLKKITQIHNRSSSDSAETIPTPRGLPTARPATQLAQHDHEDDSLHDFTFFLRGILLIAVPSSFQYSTFPPLGPPHVNLTILPLFPAHLENPHRTRGRRRMLAFLNPGLQRVIGDAFFFLGFRHDRLCHVALGQLLRHHAGYSVFLQHRLPLGPVGKIDRSHLSSRGLPSVRRIRAIRRPTAAEVKVFPFPLIKVAIVHLLYGDYHKSIPKPILSPLPRYAVSGVRYRAVPFCTGYPRSMNFLAQRTPVQWLHPIF